MLNITDLIKQTATPFNIEKFNGLQSDEYLKDEMIYCKNCNTPRLSVLPNGNKVRCICKCQEIEREEAKEKEKERKRQLEVERLQQASLMGERYKTANFENTITGHNSTFDAAYTRCKKYCEVADKVLVGGLGIYLYGDKGTGKTHLTACMANSLIKQRKQVLFTNFAEILRLITASWKKPNSDEATQIKQLATIDFLFIDDLGKERMQTGSGTDSMMQEKAFDVLNKRYNNKKPTIFTSNFSMPELINQRGMDSATVDRIAEMSSAVLKIEGESYRLKARKMAELPF